MKGNKITAMILSAAMAGTLAIGGAPQHSQAKCKTPAEQMLTEAACGRPDGTDYEDFCSCFDAAASETSGGYFDDAGYDVSCSCSDAAASEISDGYSDDAGYDAFCSCSDAAASETSDGYSDDGEYAFDEDMQLVGGWEINQGDVFPENNETVREAFEKAVEYLDGAEYEAIAYLASQFVSGTNYLILCRITPVLSEDAEPSFALATVYADLEGNAEITEITEISEIAQLTGVAGTMEPGCFD